MKRFLVSAIVIVICPSLTLPQSPTPPSPSSPPTLKIPAQITGTIGDFIQVTATTTVTNIAWRSNSTDLKLFSPEKLKEPKIAWLTSGRPGTYQLICCAGDGTGLTTIEVCAVTLSPLPTPPAPPSPLSAALQAAFTANIDPNKAQQASDLGELFLNVMSDPTLTTEAQILTRVTTARQTLIGNTMVVERGVIDADLQGLFKLSPTATIDPATMAAIKAEFTTIGNILKGLK